MVFETVLRMRSNNIAERRSLLPRHHITTRRMPWLEQRAARLCLGGIGLFCLLLFFMMFQRRQLPHDVGQPAALKGWERSFPFDRSSIESKTFKIGIVADLDKVSRITDSNKPAWRSLWLEGVLKFDGDTISVTWDESEFELQSAHSEAGRGMELSELAIFQDRLWTFDDRSGIAYEISKDHQVIPRFILTEGDGNSPKGQKTEWATVCDDKLFVGSFGKEFVNPKTNEITSVANLWVSIVDKFGIVTHENWTENYNALRKMTSTLYPGYMIIEAIEWSDIHQKWFILPRRVSEDPYDEVLDESRGSNVMLSASKDFSTVEVWKVGTLRPTHGFSSFKFVPGSDDSIVVALKTEENEKEGTQKTHIMAFELFSGKTLMDETEIPKAFKFEGLIFL
uniref:Apyrase n=2 Tax=Hirondellea gigas TaxID=1518452 RepID=A0A6A7G2S2_9CRUS